MLGIITTNDPAGFTRATAWLGHRPTLASLYFDQRSPAQFEGSIPYILNDAQAFAKLGAQIVYHVPPPGLGQYEAIVAGKWDADYKKIATGIDAQTRAGSFRFVRLFWEFNLPASYQSNAAVDKNGVYDAALYVAAYRRIAGIFRAVSPLFRLTWCPNANRQMIDPALCWPGSDVVDYVGSDCYIRAGDAQGLFKDWYLTGDRGLQWASDFAIQHGKRFSISEYGVEGDDHLNDAKDYFAWAKSLGPHLDSHHWWDRTEDINCQISGGALAKVGAAYLEAFA